MHLSLVSPRPSAGIGATFLVFISPFLRLHRWRSRNAALVSSEQHEVSRKTRVPVDTNITLQSIDFWVQRDAESTSASISTVQSIYHTTKKKEPLKKPK